VFAAHDTTRHQLGNAMVAFAQHPDQWRLLGSRPELAVQATDEVIRWLPSSATVYRFAAEDFEYRGVRFAKETYFMMCTGIAQRDPRVFRDGTTFDISVVREAQTLQFGGGPHHCLGVALARAGVAQSSSAVACSATRRGHMARGASRGGARIAPDAPRDTGGLYDPLGVDVGRDAQIAFAA
jgi:cytochrome P450